MTLKELRERAKLLGLKGYSRLNKAQLTEAAQPRFCCLNSDPKETFAAFVENLFPTPPAPESPQRGTQTKTQQGKGWAMCDRTCVSCGQNIPEPKIVRKFEIHQPMRPHVPEDTRFHRVTESNTREWTENRLEEIQRDVRHTGKVFHLVEVTDRKNTRVIRTVAPHSTPSSPRKSTAGYSD